jgi:Tfp pilus assembly protein PilF
MTRPELIAEARKAIHGRKFEVARKLAIQLLAESKDGADALEIKALVEIESGEENAAELTLRRAIAAAPDRRWPYGDLARLLLKQRRVEEAESIARAALAIDPRNADARAILGTLLLERDAAFEAAQHFTAAVDLVGRHPQLLTGLGRALMRQGDLNSVRPLLKEAMEADPSALEPVAYLAEVAEKQGRFSEAVEMLDRAEAVAQSQGRDVDLQRATLLERMGDWSAALSLLESPRDLSGAALLQRGRLYDRLERYAEAWSDWKAGKAMLADDRRLIYPAQDVEREVEALARFAAGTRDRKPVPAAEAVPQPIFIVGFPRSGTTLTEQILASHTAIRAGGELPFGRELRELAVSLVGGEPNFPERLAALPSGWPERMRDLYLERAESYGLLASGADFFTDKMPSNDMWLPLLRVAFPNSPVIRVRRHPLDILTSVMAHEMTHGFNCGYRLEDAARHLALMDQLLTRYSEAGSGATYELRYETLVGDQAAQIERLMQSIGLPMEPAQLRFHEREMVSPTPSYAQVRQPLNDRSIGRWRNYAEQLDQVRGIVTAAMRRGSYSD